MQVEATRMYRVRDVSSRTVMDLMGWSQLSMTQRYQSTCRTSCARDVADKLGRLLWASNNGEGDGDTAGVVLPRITRPLKRSRLFAG